MSVGRANPGVAPVSPQRHGQAQGYPGQYGQQGHTNASSARVTSITNVERRRNSGMRVSGTMSSGAYGYANRYSYGSLGYGNHGYNPAYANAAGDLTFQCNVDYRGAVTDIRICRNSAYRH